MRTGSNDPTPNSFASYEEAAEFWDTHDTTDYEDEFLDAEAKIEIRGHRNVVEVDEPLLRELRVRARKRGVSTSQLAADLLRQQLDLAA